MTGEKKELGDRVLVNDTIREIHTKEFKKKGKQKLSRKA